MNEFFKFSMIQDGLSLFREWFFNHILVLGNLFQVSVIPIIFVVSAAFGSRVRGYLQSRFEEPFPQQIHLNNLISTLFRLMPMIFSIFLLWLSIPIAIKLDYSHFLLSLAATLLLAWVIIKLASSVILDRFWSKLVGISAWSLAALNIMGFLNPAINFLDSFGVTLGDIRLTALSVLKTLIVLIIFLRAGMWLADYLEGKIKDIAGLSPSSHVLLSKITKIAVFAVVFIIALNSVGIDFAALAVFSGAVGVGIGLGLQKVVANLLSGIILLIDKSIKPGDIIQLGDVYGWITNLGGRYTSVVTRDGKEHLIPNENLITQQVINWSFTDRKIRLKIPIGISYKSDPHRAIDLVIEAAENVERVLKYPEPVCHLTGFGDSSVDLELRFWIDDPQNGTVNLTSRILMNVWDKFKEHNIEIPFPQRDIHLDTVSPMRILRSSIEETES
jgi:small-conductance mechanosensitive channel